MGDVIMSAVCLVIIFTVVFTGVDCAREQRRLAAIREPDEKEN